MIEIYQIFFFPFDGKFYYIDVVDDELVFFHQFFPFDGKFYYIDVDGDGLVVVIVSRVW